MRTTLLSITFLLLGFNHIFSQQLPTKTQTLDILRFVNDHWQSTNPGTGSAFWHNAAYHTGNMEAWYVTNHSRYLDYSMKWAEANQWKGAKSNNKSTWKYNYGETDDHVLFGDWQICFQTYIDLYTIKGDKQMIDRAVEVMEYQMKTKASDYWWWADGLYMVMPVMTKLYKVSGNILYLEKLHEYFSYAKNIMYDQESGLFFRDAKYVYPQHKTTNGKKDFWARGCGWVFAGLAKVLKDLPADDPHHDEYLSIFKKMAQTLSNEQASEGYWTRSLLDPRYAPGYETSGTAFFTYGYLWGINNGILDKETYLPVVVKAWKYLTEKALLKNGRVGYVQPIGEKAIPGQVVSEQSTADFGVGAFLLACSEMVRHASGEVMLKLPDSNSAPVFQVKQIGATSLSISFPDKANGRSDIRVFSATGCLLYNQKVDIVNKHVNIENIRLSCGLYFIKVRTHTNAQVRTYFYMKHSL
ncbi:MAG: glycoside hydrolase family 88 protein [Chitinispirillaceae bacterium]|nr:glycoside hydrolase family 88 protein [Chitinispirillaceae bacterium]